MYIAMSLYSEEPFPEDIKIKDHVKDYILNFDQAAISGRIPLASCRMKKHFYLIIWKENLWTITPLPVCCE